MSAAIAFSKENQARFDKTLALYEQKQSALLPTLYIAQDQWGYLTPEIMIYVAKLLDIPPVLVNEAVSFYTMFRKKDMGKYCLQICNNVTCTMRGSEDLIKVVHDELGLRNMEVSEDKMFSMMTVQCLGSCDTAPVCQVNDDYVENLNPEKFRELIRKLKGGKRAPIEEARP